MLQLVVPSVDEFLKGKTPRGSIHKIRLDTTHAQCSTLVVALHRES